MSAQLAARKEFTPFTPEERASFLAYRFGSTLEWSSRILVAINYPFDLRWFVDAVQGVCRGKERRIAHATLATRAQRFKNVSQAKALVLRAVEANNEWARSRRMMIFDIERPKPREMEGKEKRARTRYTDYLTPAAVWAQEAEQRVKKSDEVRWKKDSKHRFTVRENILAEALKQLPGFECVEDMPATATPKDPQPHSLSEYVEARERILLAENQRILGKLQDGQPVDVEEIDERIAALEVFYARAKTALDHGYESARSALLSLRESRCVRMLDFSDPLETVAEVDEILATKGNAGDPLSNKILNGKDSTKGNAHDPLSAPPESAEETVAEVDARLATKGNAGDPLSQLLPDGFEDVVIGDEAPPAEAAPALTQLDCALSYAALGTPVFPTKPTKAPYLAGGFKVATTDEATIREWWRQWPDAGIGIPTGKASGWFVLDRDDRHGGDASLSALVEQHGDLPPTSQTATPSGGAHYVFKYPESATLGNTAGKLGKGLDTRGEGGYIVAPGVDPARRWANALDPADPPEWMIGLLLSEKHEPINTDRKVVHAAFGAARVFGYGERNNGLRDVACGRWRYGYHATEQELLDYMFEARDTRCADVPNDPKPTDEWVRDMVRRTVRKYSRGDLRQEATL